MTVHFSDGFESNDFSAWTATEVTGADNSLAISSTRAKAGTYSAKAHLENAILGDKTRCYKFGLNIGSGNHIWASAWWWFPTGFDAEAALYLMKLQQSGSPYAGVMVLMNSSEQLYVRNSVDEATFTQDSPIAVPLNKWVPIELHIYAHDSSGIIELWQDRARIIEVTGIDTIPSSNYDYCFYGIYYVTGTHNGPSDLWFDEVYIQDGQKIPAPVGAIRVNPFGLRRFGGL